jgi:hypothetical protein
MIVKVRRSDAGCCREFFDHVRQYAFLAPHHTDYAIFLGLILTAIRIC